ncbi:MAG: acyltransferase family protein [Geminicoccaceae bacterium]
MAHPPVSHTATFGYLPGLDGMRALSIMVVVVAHYGLGHVVPGGFGVTVFFFVSGFLITRLLLAEKDKHGEIRLAQFYARRFARLTPPLVAFIACVSLFYAWQGAEFGLLDVTAPLLYFENYRMLFTEQLNQLPGVGQLWSLAVEEHFYLLFPAFLMVVPSRLLVRWTLVILLACLLIRYIYMFTLDNGDEWTYFASEARLDSILWGCLLAILAHQGRTGVLRVLERPEAIIAAFALLLFTFVYRDALFRETLRYTLQGVGLFVIVNALMFSLRYRWAVDMLECAPMRWLGRRSYALYLWHWQGLYLGWYLTGDHALLSPLVGLPVALLLCELSYRLVEHPFIGLRKRLGGHPVSDFNKSASGTDGRRTVGLVRDARSVL